MFKIELDIFNIQYVENREIQYFKMERFTPTEKHKLEETSDLIRD